MEHYDYHQQQLMITNDGHGTNTTNIITTLQYQQHNNNETTTITWGNIHFNNDNNTMTSIMSCGGSSFEHIASVYANTYHPYCAIVVCLFGTIANTLNVIVLTRKEMAAAPINRILTALAIADCLLMVEYVPFVYYYHLELLGKRDFPYFGAVFMLFHIHCTQILHTTSICLTLTLAIWRYLAIGYPEQNHILCSERRCYLAIVLCYLLPIALCAPTYITLKITSTHIIEDKIVYVLYHTTLNDMFERDKTLLQINFWIYAVLLKLLPCTILTIISCWLIRTLFKAKRRHNKVLLHGEYSDARAHNCSPTPTTTNNKRYMRKTTTSSKKAERRAARTTRMLVAVLLLFLVTEFPQGLFAFLIGLRGKDLFLECYQTYGDLMDILALTNGAINFILYCCMNRMFRATFGQLFKHRILAMKWAAASTTLVTATQPPRSDIVHTTYV